MKLPLLLLLVLVAALAASASAATSKTLYDFIVPGPDGKSVSLASYQAAKPVVLVVNVASQCGFTDSNYRQLQALYEKYADSGLEIMAFPCNQFGAQEPGSNSDIQRFAKEKYGVTFPVFGKVEVNGKGQHELFRFLKAEAPKDPTLPDDIRWNFGKFLVVGGVPVRRYAHDVFPEDLEREVVAHLRQAHAHKAAAASGGKGADL